MGKPEASNVIDKIASSFYELRSDCLQPFPVVSVVCSPSASVRIFRVAYFLYPSFPKDVR